MTKDYTFKEAEALFQQMRELSDERHRYHDTVWRLCKDLPYYIGATGEDILPRRNTPEILEFQGHIDRLNLELAALESTPIYVAVKEFIEDGADAFGWYLE
jgi:hypothetical protein